MSKFTDKRRQQFLPESYYKFMSKFLKDSAAYWKHGMANIDSSEDYRRHLALLEFVDETFQLWLLRFTGGEPFNVLGEELAAVVSAIEFHKKFEENSLGEPHVCTLHFEEKDEFERALQLISASILFHREDLLNRLTSIIDPAYKGQDSILEKLLSFRQEGRADVELPFHKNPTPRSCR